MSLSLLASSGGGIPAIAGWLALAAFLGGLGILFVALVRWARAQPAGPRPGIPIDEWHRRGMGVLPSEGIVEFQAGQRCPLCHVEHQPTSEASRCDACGTLFHLQCALELGGCSSLGCQGSPRRVDAIRQG